MQSSGGPKQRRFTYVMEWNINVNNPSIRKEFFSPILLSHISFIKKSITVKCQLVLQEYDEKSFYLCKFVKAGTAIQRFSITAPYKIT